MTHVPDSRRLTRSILRFAILALLAAGLFGADALAQECTTDPECDDSQVCNGVETCDTHRGVLHVGIADRLQRRQPLHRGLLHRALRHLQL